MLGSTSTATICNIGKTGNIVLIAAGHNRRNGTGVSINFGTALGTPSGLPGGCSSCSTLVLHGRIMRHRLNVCPRNISCLHPRSFVSGCQGRAARRRHRHCTGIS